jgi:hypothetical protein
VHGVCASALYGKNKLLCDGMRKREKNFHFIRHSNGQKTALCEYVHCNAMMCDTTKMRFHSGVKGLASKMKKNVIVIEECVTEFCGIICALRDILKMDRVMTFE